jgi:hypothetical protein
MEFPKKKKCTRCKDLKLRDEFWPCKKGKHGVQNECKICSELTRKEINPDSLEVDEELANKGGFKKLGMKRCLSCKNVYALDDFYGDPKKTDGKQNVCKMCLIASVNVYNLSKNFGLTREDFKKMLDAQDGRCAICRRTSKRNFSIDHDHKTHCIRGLLCTNCNALILPIIEAHPDWVEMALKYIVNPPAVNVIGIHELPVGSMYRIDISGNPILKFNHGV